MRPDASSRRRDRRLMERLEAPAIVVPLWIVCYLLAWVVGVLELLR